MTRDDEHTLLWIFGIVFINELLNRYSTDVVPVLRQGGARLYEVLHDDAGHKNDLPGHQWTREAVLQLATQTGFADPKLAAAIAFAESGGVPGAQVRSSKEWSVGLWQINLYAHPMYSAAQMKDPKQNARAALQISRGGTDWSQWSTYVNGAYHAFRTGLFAP